MNNRIKKNAVTPDLEAENSLGERVLHAAIKNSNTVMTRELLARGVATDVFTKAGLAPLHLAITFANDQANAEAMVDLLLAHNVDFTFKTRETEESAEDLALERGFTRVATTLSEARKLLQWLIEKKLSPLVILPKFLKNQIRFSMLPHLTEDHLKLLGITEVGVKLKLLPAIEMDREIILQNRRESPDKKCLSSRESPEQIKVRRRRSEIATPPQHSLSRLGKKFHHKPIYDLMNPEEEIELPWKKNSTNNDDSRNMERSISTPHIPKKTAVERQLRMAGQNFSAKWDGKSSGDKMADYKQWKLQREQDTKKTSLHTSSPIQTTKASPRKNGVRFDLPQDNWLISPSEEIKEIRKIGRGAFATVYQAEFRANPIALKKFMLPYGAELPKTLLDEIRIMNKTRNKHIIQFYGACLSPRQTYILMEYAERGDLHHVVITENPPWELRLKFAHDICLGLAYLHNFVPTPIIHRDLKSTNVLITEAHVAKLADFGLSKDTQGTMTGKQGFTTYLWAAPELYESGSHPATTSDIYSLGLVFWELITGEFPFIHEKPIVSVFAKVQNGLRPPMPSSCDPDFSDLIQKCWSADPNARPPIGDVLHKTKFMMLALNGKV